MIDIFQQQYLFENLTSDSDCSFLEEVTITFIDKTDPKDWWQKKQYGYWEHKLKTTGPLDLTVEGNQVTF